MNEHITELFDQLCEHIKQEYVISCDSKHKFRIMQLQKAKKIIATLPYHVSSVKQISSISGIGDGTCKRVSEILKTGTLAEIENTSDYIAASKIASLMKIHGIGLITARKYYYEFGIDSPDTLEKAVADGKLSVTDSMRISLKYREHLWRRIPREEIDQVIAYLKTQVNAPFDVCGSYRRGQLDSGDIDILFNKKDISSLTSLVKKLSDCLFLVAHLSTSNSTKYMGICNYGERYYRIDFMLAKPDEYATTLLHFTGSDTFNRKLRYNAIKQGYKLTEHGLFRKTIPCQINTEQDVFTILGVDYVEPHKRNE